MRILLLDDSVDNLNLRKLYAKKSSDEFSFFIDSSEALEVMKRERFDLILPAQAVIYSGDKIDITDKVLRSLKKRFKKKGKS